MNRDSAQETEEIKFHPRGRGRYTKRGGRGGGSKQMQENTTRNRSFDASKKVDIPASTTRVRRDSNPYIEGKYREEIKKVEKKDKKKEKKAIYLRSSSSEDHPHKNSSIGLESDEIHLPCLPDIEKLEIREEIKFDLSHFENKWQKHLDQNSGVREDENGDF